MVKSRASAIKQHMSTNSLTPKNSTTQPFLKCRLCITAASSLAAEASTFLSGKIPGCNVWEIFQLSLAIENSDSRANINTGTSFAVCYRAGRPPHQPSFSPEDHTSSLVEKTDLTVPLTSSTPSTGLSQGIADPMPVVAKDRSIRERILEPRIRQTRSLQLKYPQYPRPRAHDTWPATFAVKTLLCPLAAS